MKKTNDTFGHSKGDEIIITLANSVNSRIRYVDSFGRLGGMSLFYYALILV